MLLLLSVVFGFTCLGASPVDNHNEVNLSQHDAETILGMASTARENLIIQLSSGQPSNTSCSCVQGLRTLKVHLFDIVDEISKDTSQGSLCGESIRMQVKTEIEDHGGTDFKKYAKGHPDKLIKNIKRGKLKLTKNMAIGLLQNSQYQSPTPDLITLLGTVSEEIKSPEVKVENIDLNGHNELEDILLGIVYENKLGPSAMNQVLQLVSAMKNVRQTIPAHPLYLMRPDEYPKDVISARDEILEAIESGCLNASMPVGWESQSDGLLAMLTQLLQTPHSDPMAVPIHVVYSHYRLRYLACHGYTFHPDDISDIAFLLNSFLTIRSPELIQATFAEFSRSDVPWHDLLAAMDYSKYSSPRHMFLDMLRTILVHPESLKLCNNILFKYFINADANSTPDWLKEVFANNKQESEPIDLSKEVIRITSEMGHSTDSKCPKEEVTIINPEALVEIIGPNYQYDNILDLIRYNPVTPEEFPQKTRVSALRAILAHIRNKKYRDEVSDYVISQAIKRMPINDKGNWPVDLVKVCPEDLESIKAKAPPVVSPSDHGTTKEPETKCKSTFVVNQEKLLEITPERHSKTIKELVYLKPILYNEYNYLGTKKNILITILTERQKAINKDPRQFVFPEDFTKMPITWAGSLPPEIEEKCDEDLRYNVTFSDHENSEGSQLPTTSHKQPTCTDKLTINPASLIEILPQHKNTEILESLILSKQILAADYEKFTSRSSILKAILEDMIRESSNNETISNTHHVIGRLTLEPAANLPVTYLNICPKPHSTIKAPEPSLANFFDGLVDGLGESTIPCELPTGTTTPTTDLASNTQTCPEKQVLTVIVNMNSLWEALSDTAPAAPQIRAKVNSYIVPIENNTGDAKGEILKQVLESVKLDMKDPRTILLIEQMIKCILKDSAAMEAPEVTTVCIPINELEEALAANDKQECDTDEVKTSVVQIESLFDAFLPSAPKAPYIREKVKLYVVPMDKGDKAYTKAIVLESILKNLKDDLTDTRIAKNVDILLHNIRKDGPGVEIPETIEICLPEGLEINSTTTKESTTTQPQTAQEAMPAATFQPDVIQTTDMPENEETTTQELTTCEPDTTTIEETTPALTTTPSTTTTTEEPTTTTTTTTTTEEPATTTTTTTTEEPTTTTTTTTTTELPPITVAEDAITSTPEESTRSHFETTTGPPVTDLVEPSIVGSDSASASAFASEDESSTIAIPLSTEPSEVEYQPPTTTSISSVSSTFFEEYDSSTLPTALPTEHWVTEDLTPTEKSDSASASASASSDSSDECDNTTTTTTTEEAQEDGKTEETLKTDLTTNQSERDLDKTGSKSPEITTHSEVESASEIEPTTTHVLSNADNEESQKTKQPESASSDETGVSLPSETPSNTTVTPERSQATTSSDDYSSTESQPTTSEITVKEDTPTYSSTLPPTNVTDGTSNSATQEMSETTIIATTFPTAAVNTDDSQTDLTDTVVTTSSPLAEITTESVVQDLPESVYTSTMQPDALTIIELDNMVSTLDRLEANNKNNIKKASTIPPTSLVETSTESGYFSSSSSRAIEISETDPTTTHQPTASSDLGLSAHSDSEIGNMHINDSPLSTEAHDTSSVPSDNKLTVTTDELPLGNTQSPSSSSTTEGADSATALESNSTESINEQSTVTDFTPYETSTGTLETHSNNKDDGNTAITSEPESERTTASEELSQTDGPHPIQNSSTVADLVEVTQTTNSTPTEKTTGKDSLMSSSAPDASADPTIMSERDLETTTSPNQQPANPVETDNDDGHQSTSVVAISSDDGVPQQNSSSTNDVASTSEPNVTPRVSPTLDSQTTENLAKLTSSFDSNHVETNKQSDTLPSTSVTSSLPDNMSTERALLESSSSATSTIELLSTTTPSEQLQNEDIKAIQNSSSIIVSAEISRNEPDDITTTSASAASPENELLTSTGSPDYLSSSTTEQDHVPVTENSKLPTTSEENSSPTVDLPESSTVEAPSTDASTNSKILGSTDSPDMELLSSASTSVTPTPLNSSPTTPDLPVSKTDEVHSASASATADLSKQESINPINDQNENLPTMVSSIITNQDAELGTSTINIPTENKEEIENFTKTTTAANTVILQQTPTADFASTHSPELSSTTSSSELKSTTPSATEECDEGDDDYPNSETDEGMRKGARAMEEKLPQTQPPKPCHSPVAILDPESILASIAPKARKKARNMVKLIRNSSFLKKNYDSTQSSCSITRIILENIKTQTSAKMKEHEQHGRGTRMIRKWLRELDILLANVSCNGEAGKPPRELLKCVDKKRRPV